MQHVSYDAPILTEAFGEVPTCRTQELTKTNSHNVFDCLMQELILPGGFCRTVSA